MNPPSPHFGAAGPPISSEAGRRRWPRSCRALILAVLFSPVAVPAAETGRAAVDAALQKLAGAPGYHWTTTLKSDSDGEPRPPPLEGRTARGGWTYTTSTFNGTKIEIAFKGSQALLHREGEWQTAEELEHGDNPWLGRMLKTFQLPVAEAGELAGKAAELKQDGDGEYAGPLSVEGATMILARRSRPGGNGPSNAQGWVRFWIRDGVLVKYGYRLRGTVARADGGTADVDRTTIVEMKNIGSTRVDVPEGARKKLEQGR